MSLTGKTIGAPVTPVCFCFPVVVLLLFFIFVLLFCCCFVVVLLLCCACSWYVHVSVHGLWFVFCLWVGDTTQLSQPYRLTLISPTVTVAAAAAALPCLALRNSFTFSKNQWQARWALTIRVLPTEATPSLLQTDPRRKRIFGTGTPSTQT